MTTKLTLPLTDIFEPHSLKLYTTIKQCAMPIVGRRFYVWCEIYEGNEEISKVLQKGRKWNHGGNSINNYIDLKEPIYDIFCNHVMNYGPNSSSLIQTVRFMILPSGEARVLAEGWGHSHVVLYDGPPQQLLEYLLQYQDRKDEPVAASV